jgi:phosphate transport system permease protein
MTLQLATPGPSVTAAPDPVRRRPSRGRRPRQLTALDAASMAACVATSSSLAWLLFAKVTDGVGWFGFLLCAYIGAVSLYFLVTSERLGRLTAVDQLATIIVGTIGVVVAVPLVLLIGYLVVKGITALRLTFFTEDQAGITPTQPATAGGGSHAVVGTIQQVGLALLWALPLGLATAVFLNESRSRWRRVVRIVVDSMSGLPSVVAGLFIFATLILPLAETNAIFSFNGFMASLALALTMLPTIARTVELVLRLVPNGLREASLAMGASRARTVWSVVLPTARTGMATAVVLGIARAVGETAPLLFTAFGYDLMNADPFHGAQESLPLFVYRNIRKPDVNAIARGYAGALVLMFIVLALFAVARIIGRDRTGSTHRRRFSWRPSR